MPKIVNREEKREQILLSALKVFAQKGYYNTKISEIAKEAGIGKGTIYEYFRSKESIFAEGFQFMFSSLEEELMKIIVGDASPEEKLDQLMEVSFYELTKYGERFIEVLMDFWAESIRSKHPGMKTLVDMTPMYTEFRKLIAAIIGEGVKKGLFRNVDPKMEASILMAIMDGLMLQWVLDKNAFSLDEARKAIKRHFMNALK